MRIVIGGAGEVGRGVAKALRSEGRDVVLIDSDPIAIKEAQALDVLVVQGDATRRPDLIEAGIEQAEVYIAATQRDEINLISCSLANDISVNSENSTRLMTIARIHDASLICDESVEQLRRWSGVHHVVCSDELVIKDLKVGVRGTSMVEVLSLGKDAWVTMVEVQPQAEFLVNSTLQQAEDKVDGLPRVFGLKEPGKKSMIPNSNTVITENSLLAFATVGKHTFSRILMATGHQPPEFPEQPRIMIFGGTRLGQEIAKSYLKDGCRVTVISEKLEGANELAGADFANTELLDSIHGNPLDQELLRELDISEHDIAITALKDDHANMAVAMQATEMGVGRVGMVLDDSQMAQIARRIGHSFAVSRRRVAINYILRQVHSKVEGNYHLFTSIPEIVGMSALISPGHRMIGKRVKELEGKSCRVAFLHRTTSSGSESIVRATSDLEFKEGDRLMLFARVKDIEKIENRLSGS
ncbi:MAG: NAD-binding protein [Euryarchaeota archaeon]|nr:NAD-binding protein [Euryarchaeota archaeon]